MLPQLPTGNVANFWNNWSKANFKTLEEAKRENKKKVSNDKQIEQRKYTEDEFESLYANKE